MTEFTCYKLTTGEITCTGAAPEYMVPLQANEITGVFEGSYSGVNYYFQNGSPVPRPQINTTVTKPVIWADGLDTTRIQIPVPGTLVTWPDGVQTDDTDGYVDFAVDTPGTYTFRIEKFPFKTREITIEANPVI